jgi:hypothetical protein
VPIVVATEGAEITSFTPPHYNFARGDATTASVSIENTETDTRSFWIGLSYQKPSGDWYPVIPQESNELTPGEEETLQFDFILPNDAELGSYNAVTAIWHGYDSANNKMIEPTFHKMSVNNAFEVGSFENGLIRITGEINDPAKGIIEIPIHVKLTSYNHEYRWFIEVDEMSPKEDEYNFYDLPHKPPYEFDDVLKVTTFHYTNDYHTIKVVLQYRHFMGGDWHEVTACEKEVVFNNPNPVPQGWEPGAGGSLSVEQFFDEETDNEIFNDLRNRGYIKTEDNHYIQNVYRDFISKDEAWATAVANSFINIYSRIDAYLTAYSVTKFVVEGGDPRVFVANEVATFAGVSVLEVMLGNSPYWNVGDYAGSDHGENHYVEYVTVDYGKKHNVKFDNIDQDHFRLWETRLYHLNKNDVWEYKANMFEFGAYLQKYKEDYGEYIEFETFNPLVEKEKKVNWLLKVQKVLPRQHGEKDEYYNNKFLKKNKPIGNMFLDIILPENLKLSDATIEIKEKGLTRYIDAIMSVQNNGKFKKSDEIPAGKRGAIKIPIVFNAEEKIELELTGVEVGFGNEIRYGLAYEEDADESKFTTSEISVIPSDLRKEPILEKDIKILPWDDGTQPYNIVLINRKAWHHLQVFFDDKYMGGIPSSPPNFDEWHAFKTANVKKITLFSKSDVSSYFGPIYTKDLNDLDYNLKNRPADDFEGEIKDEDISIERLSDGQHRVTIRNNLRSSLSVFLYSKESTTWQQFFRIPPGIIPPREDSTILNFKPDFIIAETENGIAWYKRYTDSIDYDFDLTATSRKDEYQPGETAQVTIDVTNNRDQDTEIWLGTTFKYPTLKDPEDIPPKRAVIPKGETESFDIAWTIPADAPLGQYEIAVNCWKDAGQNEYYTDNIVWAPIFNVDMITPVKARENVEDALGALASMAEAYYGFMELIYELSEVEPPEGSEVEFNYHVLSSMFCNNIAEAETYMSSSGIESADMNDALELVRELELAKEGFCIVIVDYSFMGFGEYESGTYPIVCNEKGDPFWESWQFYEMIKEEIEVGYKEYEG